MEKKYMEIKLKKDLEEIKYCERMMSLQICPYVKMKWMNLTIHKVTNMIKEIESEKSSKVQSLRQPQKEFTLEELLQYDGSTGKPAYVAVDGVVYDVSFNPQFGGGTHFGLYAGKDLSLEFKACHKDRPEIVNTLPVVGVLKNK